MKERPIRFVIRTLIGVATFTLAVVEWSLGDLEGALKTASAGIVFAGYVSVVMREEARI